MSWKTTKLESLCKMHSGGTPSRGKKNYYSGDIPWAKISDIETAEGGVIYNTEEKITEEGLNAINNRIFEKGTLLLAMYGSVGKVAFAGTKMSTNQAILGINIKDTNFLDYSYLKYWFQTIKSQLLDRAVGGTLQNISLGIVKDLEIPLPPLATQKRIAEILDAADALRRKDQELLKKYDELAQAIFIDMFGDPVKNEKGWEVKKLGSVTKMKAGNFISASEINTELGDNLYPCYGGNGLRGFVKSYTHDGNYILIGRQGALCGNVKITSSKFYATEHAVVCTPKMEYNVLWLYYLLGALNLNKFASGAAQPGLNVSTLVDIEVIFAPLKLQNQFAEKLELIEEQNTSVKGNLIKTNQLFNSLIKKAFKGELVA